MPRRRLSVVVATGVLALAALAGCQDVPGATAVVGDTSYTRASVNDVATTFEADLAKVPNAQKIDDEAGLRETIASYEVFIGVASRYADENHLGSPSVDTASLASQSGLPENDPYLQLFARSSAYRDLLLEKASSVKPTDAELHEAYGNVVKSGLHIPFDQVASQLPKVDRFGEAIAVLRELKDAIVRYDVRVSPMYGSLSFPILTVTNQGTDIDVIVVSLGGKDSDPVVHDVPTP